jgi:hypothetical protein
MGFGSQNYGDWTFHILTIWHLHSGQPGQLRVQFILGRSLRARVAQGITSRKSEGLRRGYMYACMEVHVPVWVPLLSQEPEAPVSEDKRRWMSHLKQKERVFPPSAFLFSLRAQQIKWCLLMRLGCVFFTTTTDSNANFLSEYPTVTPRNNSLSAIWASLNSVKLTWEIHHHLVMSILEECFWVPVRAVPVLIRGLPNHLCRNVGCSDSELLCQTPLKEVCRKTLWFQLSYPANVAWALPISMSWVVSISKTLCAVCQLLLGTY